MRSIQGIIQRELEGDLARLGWKHTKGCAWEKDGIEAHYTDAVAIELKKIQTPNPPNDGMIIDPFVGMKEGT